MKKKQQKSNIDQPVVSGSAGYVIAKCMVCKQKKQYDMSKPLNHTPMCEKCFMPMIAQKVVVHQ